MKGSRNKILTAVGLGTVFVTSGLSISRYRREMDLIREKIDNLGSETMGSDSGTVEFARAGSGYPVLTVHGNAGGFDQGLGLAQAYLPPGCQVIAPSRFGYLRSPIPAGATPTSQADIFGGLLDALGIEQAAILASSAGVTSSVQFALRYPKRVSALILHSPNAPGQEGLVPPPKALFKLMLSSDYIWWALNTYLGSRMQSFVGVPSAFPLNPQHNAEVRSALIGTLPVSERADGMIFDTYVSNPEINRLPLGKINTPTLVISAVDDPMALHENARTLAAQIPGARLMAVRDGGHLLLGHSQEVKMEVTQFLHDLVNDNPNSHQSRI